jgi:hypothetical protein
VKRLLRSVEHAGLRERSSVGKVFYESTLGEIADIPIEDGSGRGGSDRETFGQRSIIFAGVRSAGCNVDERTDVLRRPG